MINFEIVLLIAFITALSHNTPNVQSSSSVEVDELSATNGKIQRLLNEVTSTVFDNREKRVGRKIVRGISDLTPYVPGVSVIRPVSSIQRYNQLAFHSDENIKYPI